MRGLVAGSSQVIVMPGLDPGIHLSLQKFFERMDCRVKPGNDEPVFPFEPIMR
jgi:hypothetical protein